MSLTGQFRSFRSVPPVRRRVSAALAAGAVCFVVVGLVATSAGPAQAADARVGLGTTASFAVLAGSTVTNTGPSILTGSLGLSPGSAVTGFPPGVVLGGTKLIGNAAATTAKNDLVTAYNDAAGRPSAADVTDEDLGGLTLTPGVYEASTTMALTGTLTLNAQGNPDAVFIFKAGTSLVTATGSRVQFVNGGSSCNVFWKVGSSATLGSTTHFVGTILALTSASLGTAATVEGRVLARNGAVTLDSNVITAPGCATSTPPASGSATGTATATATASGSGTSTSGGSLGTSTETASPFGPGDDDSASAGSSTTAVPSTGSQSPSPTVTPSSPAIPRDHPRTGSGLPQDSSGLPFFGLAGVAAAAALAAGALSGRRAPQALR